MFLLCIKAWASELALAGQGETSKSIPEVKYTIYASDSRESSGIVTIRNEEITSQAAKILP